MATTHLRTVPLLLAGIVAALTIGASPALAFKIEPAGNVALDGQIVMSPAVDRVVTIQPDGGDPISPGATVTRSIVLQNRTKSALTFDLDIAQAVGSTAQLVVEVRHGVRQGAASWAELERSIVRLKPGERGTIGVTVRIPRSVKPGSKLFAVTATQRSGPVETTGAGVAPQFKQVGIYVLELPGDAPVDGRLTKVSMTSAQKIVAATRDGKPAPRNSRWYISPNWTDSHRLTLSTEYENKGERLLSPTGTVVVRDIFGRVAGRYAIKPFSVYPEGESASTVELRGLPSLGIFTAKIELKSEAAGTQTTTLNRFIMIPKWLIAAVAAFIVYGSYRGLRFYLRRRREWKRYLQASEADQGDGHGDDEHDEDLFYEDLVERA